MIKRLKPISFVFIVMFLSGFLSVCTSAMYSGECGENLTWVIDDEGTLTISGTGDMFDYAYNSTAPWYSNRTLIENVVIDKSVTSIGDYAFYECDNLEHISISNSVKRIGHYSFYCNKIENIFIPANVADISHLAFDRSYGLKKIVVDSSNKHYSNDEIGVLFDKEKNTLIQFPIGNSATKYVIPNSVTEIFGSSFANCSNLESITIPDGVKHIGNGAFTNCYKLNSITIPHGIKSIEDFTFKCCESLTSINIPNTVTNIGWFSFVGCTNLVSIILPNSITSIEENAFSDCGNIKTIFYEGTRAEWYRLNIATGNSVLNNATLYTNYVLGDFLKGDINADSVVSILDASAILRHLAGYKTGCDVSMMDTNGDGTVSIRDASAILRYLAGYDVTLH